MFTGFKRPLRPGTKELYYNEMDRLEKYLMGLKFVNGQLLVHSANKRGFVGLILAMASFKGIYESYVENDQLKYLLRYKFSQDHLETFFSAVRSRGGFNDNPNVSEFKSAYKRILVKTEIKTTKSANCMTLDDTSILSISSTQEKNKTKNFLKNIATEEDYESAFFESIIDIDLNDYVEDVVTYISGYVQRQLLENMECTECCEAVLSDAIIENCQLIELKNIGGLIKPSTVIKQICISAEKTFRINSDEIGMEKLIRSTFRHLDPSVFDSMNDHFLNSDPIENHRLLFVKSVLHQYFKLRIHHKNAQTVEENRKIKIRNFYKKMVHFKGQ